MGKCYNDCKPKSKCLELKLYLPKLVFVSSDTGDKIFWGEIGGAISNQKDLWGELQSLHQTDSNQQTLIQQNETDIDAVQGELQDINRALGDKLDADTFDKANSNTGLVSTNVDFTVNGDSVQVSQWYIDTHTKNEIVLRKNMPLADQGHAGLMSYEDKTKLDNLEDNAVLDVDSGSSNVHVSRTGDAVTVSVDIPEQAGYGTYPFDDTQRNIGDTITFDPAKVTMVAGTLQNGTQLYDSADNEAGSVHAAVIVDVVNNIAIVTSINSGTGTWGKIDGKLTDQTDLKNALDNKTDEVVTTGDIVNTIQNSSSGEALVSTNVNRVETAGLKTGKLDTDKAYSDLSVTDPSGNGTHITQTSDGSYINQPDIDGPTVDTTDAGKLIANRDYVNNQIADSLTDHPINDGALTIQKEGVAIGTFTANQSAAKTVNIIETDPTVINWAKNRGSVLKAIYGVGFDWNDIVDNGIYLSMDMTATRNAPPNANNSGSTVIVCKTATGLISQTVSGLKRWYVRGFDGTGWSTWQQIKTDVTYSEVTGTPKIGNATINIKDGTNVIATFTTNQEGADVNIDLSKVSFSGSYNDLSDKPSIPVVNNPAINIQKNGVTAGSFTLNQATPASQNINLTFGTMADAAASDYRTASEQDAIDATHLTKDNIIPGSNVSVSKNGNNCTISVTGIQVPDVYYTPDTITGAAGDTITGLLQANLEIVYATGTITAEVGDTVYFDGGAGVISVVTGDEITGTYDLVIVNKQTSTIFSTIGGNASDNPSLVNYVSEQLSNNIISWAFKNNRDVPVAGSADDALANGFYIVDSGLLLTAKKGAFIQQILFTHDNNVARVRSSNDSGVTFNEWATVNTANDSAVKLTTPTKGDIDNFTLNQGTDKTISLADVAKSGSYNDLSDKPSIPTVNNGTLTIKKEGEAIGTFTANQGSASTVDIIETDPTVPPWAKQSGKPTYVYSEIDGTPTFKTVGGEAITGEGDIDIPTVGSGALKLQTSATTQGKVPTATEISNANQASDTTLILHDVARTGSYNDLLNRPGIPTNTNQLTNGAGFITASAIKDSTITIQKNGVDADSFTLNQDTDKTVNIAVPTRTSELTNDSGFATTSQIPTVNNGALKIISSTTPQTAPTTAVNLGTADQSGDTTTTLHKAAWTGTYSDLNDTPTFKTVGGNSITGNGNIPFPAIPTVNDSTLTLTAGETTQTFKQNSGGDKSFTVPDVSESTAGLMSTTDYAKLAGIATGADITPPLIKKIVCVSGSTTQVKITATKNCTLTGYVYSTGDSITVTPSALIANTETTVTLSGAINTDVSFSVS